MKPPITLERLDERLISPFAWECARDGHLVPGATHAFVRTGEIVGGAALCAPLIIFWSHTKRMHPRESLQAVRLARAEADAISPHHLCACTQDSPFFPLMPRIGYRRLGYADLFQRA